MKIKICGIKNLEEAIIMNDCAPDFIGFVFAKSKREISFDTAQKLSSLISPKIKRVGVFTDKNTDEIIKYKEIIDIAQLHGNYNETDINTLQNAGFEVIKVIPVKENKYEIKTGANYILFDTFKNGKTGGTGEAFNWNIQIKTDTPFFIAGGINSENIYQMAQKLKPYGADVSSSVEFQGFKTKEKVSDIIKIAKGINL